MPTASACGVVSVSIDAEPSSKNSTASAEAIDSVVVELFDQFQRQRLPATWMIGDPKRHVLADRIVRTGRHELALSSVLGSNTKQGSISHLLECQRAGLTITTIGENPAWQQRDIDLLAKHGITIIRSLGSSSSNRGLQSARYGMWYVPVSATLQGGGWVPYFAQLQRLKRTVEQVIRQTGICHVRIDAPSFARGDVASGLRAAERLLAHLNQMQQANSVDIVTLHDTAVRLQPKRNVAAAVSILRAA